MLHKSQFILSGSHDKAILGDSTYDDKYTNQEMVLFIHGFKGFKDWGAHQLVADFFAKKGYYYLKFNFSHGGTTPQQPDEVTDMDAFASNTIAKEIADLNIVINHISHTQAFSRINLIGHSRGAALAILKAADDPRIQKVVTWSAINDFSSLWKKEQEESWKKEGQIFVENARTKEKMPLNVSLLEDFKAHKAAYNLIDAAKRITIPWLILHGDQDVNVPFSVAQQLAQAQPAAKLQKIEGASHVYGASHPYKDKELPEHLQEVCDKTLAFLKA